MYAQAWCLVAQELTSATPGSGKTINESAWKSLAEGRIREAKGLGTLDEDSASRLESAEDSYAKGHYGAAIFDSVYVIQGQEAAGNDTTVLNESRDSLWGRIYQSHAVFLYQQNQTTSALKTAKLAKAFDQAVLEMKAAISYPSGATQGPLPVVEEEKQADSGIFYIAAAAIVFLLGIVVILLIIYGKPKRPLKAYGAGQKKGRA
jgi:hypothetical protein